MTSETYTIAHTIVGGTHHYGGGHDDRFNGTTEYVTCPAPECGKQVQLHGGAIMAHANIYGFLCDYNGRRPTWRPVVDLATGRLLNDGDEGMNE